MRAKLTFSAAVALIACGMNFGVSHAAERSTTTPPAVSNPKDTAKTTAAPVAGKNSFTEGEARRRITTSGYGDVSELTKDAKSIWHAKATKGGKAVNVTLDYQGNITEE